MQAVLLLLLPPLLLLVLVPPRPTVLRGSAQAP
jgi:hypothetical protein